MAPSQEALGKRVCVVGAGVAGLVAVKNLKEQGFEVTAIERNSFVGGLWHVNDDPGRVSALPGTQSNSSKYTFCLSDFPMSKSVPLYPRADDLGRYLEDYAQHFALLPSIELSTDVLSVSRDESDKFWLVRVREMSTGQEATRQFDRVVMASGMDHTPRQLSFRGAEKFRGELIHSREFKSAAKYVGKKVLVVGAGASGLDTARCLHAAGAAATYLSHRSRIGVVPLVFRGRVTEHLFTHRRLSLLRARGKWASRLVSLLSRGVFRYLKYAEFPWLRRHSSTRPYVSSDDLTHRYPILPQHMRHFGGEGAVQSVAGTTEISGPDSVAFADGHEMSGVDAIIVCSGYSQDYSLVKGPGNPADARYADDGFARFKAAPFYKAPTSYARLYQGTFSERYPESLAFIGYLFLLRTYIYQCDLFSMAVAGFWSGGFPVPSAAEMKAHIDDEYERTVAMMQRGPLPTPGYRFLDHAIMDWMHDVAGTGVQERLRYWSREAWKFWWNDRSFYKLLADGPPLPAFNRCFDTGRGRKPWPGARAHIEEVHRELESDDFKRRVASEYGNGT